MRLQTVLVSVVVSGVLLLVSLGACRSAGTVSLGREFSLAVGKSVSVSGEDLTVMLDSVPEDSRCPRDVTCIWEGQARAVVRVTSGGDTEPIDLIQPGLTDQPSTQEYRGYTFTYAIEPYPTEGQAIAPDDYSLRLTITR